MKNNDYTKMIGDLHAPSSAVEKALKSAREKANTVSLPPPSTSPKKSVLRLSRRALLAASIVFVSALSVSVFFLFRNNPVPITPSFATSATLSPTSTAAPTAASASQQESQTASLTEPSTQYPTQISTDSEGNIIITITEITTPGEDNGPAEPSEKQSPTQSPQNPTDKASEQPTQQPTSAPRTEEPKPSEPCVADETVGEDPTQDPGPAAPELILSKTLTVWTENTDEIRNNHPYIYCRIYDEYGTLLGDENLFSAQHRIEVDKNASFILYYGDRRGIELPEAGGLYTYVFYTGDGTDFDSGQIYVFYD